MRIAVVEDSRVVELHLFRTGQSMPGQIGIGRLVAKEAGRNFLKTADGQTILLHGQVEGTEGTSVRYCITRAECAEPGQVKCAEAVLADADAVDKTAAQCWAGMVSGLSPVAMADGIPKADLSPVIDAAMAKGGRKFAAEYGWKVDYLRIVTLGLPDDRTVKVPAVLERLTRYQWLRDIRFDLSRWLRDWSILIPTEAERYRADCDRDGVPLPPDWNRGGWTRQSVGMLTEVPQALLFLALGNPVEVWASNDRSRGACIALPRWGAGKASATLGIICQSRTTGKACFWDNRPHAGGAKFTLAEMNANSVTKDWVNGRDAALVGGGKCVQCHRGGNVFLIHPDTPLALVAPAFQTNPAVRYTPLTTLGWTNPPATAVPALAAGQQSCAGCHEIGNTSVEKASYCAFLRMAANREMPGTGASRAGWGTTVPPDIATRPQFVDMMAFLKTQCGTSP